MIYDLENVRLVLAIVQIPIVTTALEEKVSIGSIQKPL